MVEHKAPLSATPSPYVSSWLTKIVQLDQYPLRLCLDLASGFGRHSILASKYFENVVAVDNGEKVSTSRWHEKYDNIYFLRSDLTEPLPFHLHQFDLVLLIHYYDEKIVNRIWENLKYGGFLILETVDNRGGNWQDLPIYSEFISLLDSRFKIIDRQLELIEKKPARLRVKAVLQKI